MTSVDELRLKMSLGDIYLLRLALPLLHMFTSMG